MVRSQITIKITRIFCSEFCFRYYPLFGPLAIHAREEFRQSWIIRINKVTVTPLLTERNIPVLPSKFPPLPTTPQIWPVTPLTNTDYPKINFSKESNPLSTTGDWERATRSTC